MGEDGTGLVQALCIGLLSAALQLSAATAAASDLGPNARVPFNIPRQRADLALIEFAEQADLTFIFPFEEARQKSANRLVGSYTRDEAIRILLEGTGLQPEFKGDGAMTVRSARNNETEGNVMLKKKRGIIASLLAAIALYGGATLAQTDGAGSNPVIEEVIVTAQKRAESVQEIPIAIQALSREELERLGIRRADDILGLYSSVSSISQAELNRNFFIRGVGTNDFHLNSVGAVGIYLDEVSVTSPYAATFSLYDMERVEVLRGPQNTLLGRNTTGGAVNYITRAPDVTDAMNGYVSAGYGRYDQVDVEGAFGIPLGDSAAIRVSGIGNWRDGPFENLTAGGDDGERDRQAGRVQIRWDATDNLSLLGNIHGGISRGEGRPWKNTGILDPVSPYLPDGAGGFVPNPCPVPLAQQTVPDNSGCADASGFTHPYDDWQQVYPGLPLLEDLDAWGGSLRIDWTYGTLTFTSVSSYESTELERNEDSDAQANHLFQFYQENELDQWSQDFRIKSGDDQSWRWIAGLFYFFEESQYATAVRRTPPGSAPFLTGVPGTFTIIPNTMVDQDNEVLSLYGQFEHDLSEALTLTVGLRWTDESKSGYNKASVRCGGGTFGPPFCDLVPVDAHIGRDEIEGAFALLDLPKERLHNEERITGFRGALDWHVTDDILAYTSISRGFKSGGFSIAALQAINGLAAQAVDPEILWAYEVGAKSSWLGNTLELNGAFFWYVWEDMQIFEPFLDPAVGVAIPQLVNVPDVRVLGFDLEGKWIPAEGWLVQGGIGILDSEVQNPGSIVTIQKGNEIVGAPDFTFNGLLRKEFQVGNGTLALQTNWRYTDKVFYSITNDPRLIGASNWNLNARGSYAFGRNGQFEISVWGENLTDAEYCTGATTLEGLAESILCIPNDGEPLYGLTVTVRFE